MKVTAILKEAMREAIAADKVYLWTGTGSNPTHEMGWACPLEDLLDVRDGESLDTKRGCYLSIRRDEWPGEIIRRRDLEVTYGGNAFGRHAGQGSGGLAHVEQVKRKARDSTRDSVVTARLNFPAWQAPTNSLIRAEWTRSEWLAACGEVEP